MCFYYFVLFYVLGVDCFFSRLSVCFEPTFHLNIQTLYLLWIFSMFLVFIVHRNISPDLSPYASFLFLVSFSSDTPIFIIQPSLLFSCFSAEKFARQLFIFTDTWLPSMFRTSSYTFIDYGSSSYLVLMTLLIFRNVRLDIDWPSLF